MLSELQTCWLLSDLLSSMYQLQDACRWPAGLPGCQLLQTTAISVCLHIPCCTYLDLTSLQVCLHPHAQLHPALQVPIFDLLHKFNGQQTTDDIKAGRRRFRITKLPEFLVLHIKRFTKNRFYLEKNPTIVNFPVKNLELADIIPVPTGVSIVADLQYMCCSCRQLAQPR